MDKRLEKKNIIITGSGGGIGFAAVKRLAESGANIWACMRNPNETAEAAFGSLAQKNGVKIEPVYFDLTDSEAIKRELSGILAEKKEIHGLVNGAGVPHGGFFAMTPIRRIREIFDINFFAALEVTQRVLKQMTRQKFGAIVNIASISGQDLKAGNCAYGASKAALIAWTRTLAAEAAAFGIRVNAVAPGLTDTRMAEQMEQRAGADMVARSAMKRKAKPEEIADVICYLLSDESSFINGETIRADGGRC